MSDPALKTTTPRDRIALIVSGRPPLDATRDEHRVAAAVIRLGEKLERRGYLPETRRAAMVERMMEMMREAGL